jgi:hypothetical protein
MKYGSRKFIVTLLTLVATVYLGSQGKVDANVALILSAIVGSYNVVNGYVEGKRNE